MATTLNTVGILITACAIGWETKSVMIGAAVATGMFTIIAAIYNSQKK